MKKIIIALLAAVMLTVGLGTVGASASVIHKPVHITAIAKKAAQARAATVTALEVKGTVTHPANKSTIHFQASRPSLVSYGYSPENQVPAVVNCPNPISNGECAVGSFTIPQPANGTMYVTFTSTYTSDPVVVAITAQTTSFDELPTE